MTPPPSPAARVALWDAALSAVRTYFRDAGLREVMTPPRVPAVAIEPWIEPVTAPPGWLHTSPELAMKSLVAHGSGPIFQITYVARASERGAWHREQFVLLEWYRLHGDPADDVAALVARVLETLAPWGRPSTTPPDRWSRVAFLDAVRETTGLALGGDEDGETLTRALEGSAWSLPTLRTTDPAARTLEAWTAFFTAWSDAALDPWLATRADAGEGIHLIAFPGPLAALAERSVDATGRSTSGRFESHAFGRELANGYRELRDPIEQRARFTAVAALREAYGAPPLPMPEAFLADLQDPGLPRCSGAALGLERLVALAIGAACLDDIALLP